MTFRWHDDYSSIRKSHFHFISTNRFQLTDWEKENNDSRLRRQKLLFFSLCVAVILFIQTASRMIFSFLLYEHSVDVHTLQCNVITGNSEYLPFSHSIEIFAFNTRHFFSSVSFFSLLSDIKISKILCINDNRVSERKNGIYTSLSFSVYLVPIVIQHIDWYVNCDMVRSLLLYPCVCDWCWYFVIYTLFTLFLLSWFIGFRVIYCTYWLHLISNQ